MEKPAKNSKNTDAPATPPAPPAAPKANTKPEVLATRTDIPMPEVTNRRGSKSPYPFATMEVGESFGVKGRDKKSFNSIIYTAEKRFAVEVKNDDGSTQTRVKEGKDGSREVVPVTEKTREFHAFDVDPKADPENATVRIFRTK